MQRTVWWSAFLVFALGLSCAWGLAILGDRAATLEQAATRLEATARVLEQHADRAFEAGDRVVRALAEIARPHDLRAPEEARRLHGQLRGVIADSPQISSAWVVDADGVTRVENWGHPPRTHGSFAHRDYFRALRDDPGRGLFIGALQTGGTTGRPRFTLARPLRGPDGQFAGVVVAGVYSEYFGTVYRDAALGLGARLSLATLDGAPLTAWPDGPSPASEATGALRVVRDLDRYPVRVTITQPVEAILADWRKRAMASGIGALVVVAAFGGLTALGLRSASREAEAMARLEAANLDLERRVEQRTADLAASRAELQSRYDTAPVGLCMLTPDLRFVRVNRRLAEINGVPAEAHLGRRVAEVVPGIAASVTALGELVVRTGEPALNMEVDGETPARPGVRRTWNESWLPLKGKDGAVVGINIVAEEITERKAAEESIRTLLERTRQLSEYNEVAAREMGHRIMNSLQTLETFLVMQAKAAHDSAAQAVIELATQRVRAMAVVQRRLFHATREDVRTLDLGAYLQDLCDDLAKSFLTGDRCTLAVEAEPGIRVAAADGSAAAMVVAELVINACKYAFGDGDRGRLTVRLSRADAGYRIEVRDDGKGLPAGFDPKASKGLGMRIMQGMTRQLGGTLEIDTKSPGTGFVLLVPGNRPKSGQEVAQAEG